jgi:hypothetical protein
MYSLLNCHNVAKHAEFYLGKLRFNVTSTGNTGRFKKSFAIVFQMLLSGECYENVHKLSTVRGVERWIVCKPLSVRIARTAALLLVYQEEFSCIELMKCYNGTFFEYPLYFFRSCRNYPGHHVAPTPWRHPGEQRSCRKGDAVSSEMSFLLYNSSSL